MGSFSGSAIIQIIVKINWMSQPRRARDEARQFKKSSQDSHPSLGVKSLLLVLMGTITFSNPTVLRLLPVSKVANQNEKQYLNNCQS